MGLLGGLAAAARDGGIDLIGATTAEPLGPEDDWWGHDQPRDVLPGARSVVVAGFCTLYEPRPVPSEPGAPRGRFTAFASRIFVQMERHCWDVVGGYLRERGYAAVEAPRIAIKPAVARSGLGRYGKHGVVVTPELGSMVMFACVVTDAPLAEPAADAPIRGQTCPEGCRLCVDACPTRALPGDYTLDRSKCITNWLWGAFAPADLRTHQGDRLFGCAECLLACPHNRPIAPRSDHPVPVDTIADGPELLPLAAGDRDYWERFVPTFPQRAGLEAMRGNAVVALGNAADPAATAELARTLRSENPQLRAYSAWALGRLAGPTARHLLESARALETEQAVLAEIEAALA